MIKPTIHRNGTSGQDLSNKFSDALEAVQSALDHLHESSPNGRDYYPQGGHAISQAMAEHQARVSRLESVKDELVQLAQHCDEWSEDEAEPARVIPPYEEEFQQHLEEERAAAIRGSSWY
jgi:hypothetical protein